MAKKKVISLSFTYLKEVKNYHVYLLAGGHAFFPKKIYVSKKDVKDAGKKATVNVVI